MLIGITEAARRLEMTPFGARRAFERDGVPIVKIHERTYAVEESDLEKFMAERGGKVSRGRPRKKKDGYTQAVKERAAAPLLTMEDATPREPLAKPSRTSSKK